MHLEQHPAGTRCIKPNNCTYVTLSICHSARYPSTAKAREKNPHPCGIWIPRSCCCNSGNRLYWRNSIMANPRNKSSSATDLISLFSCSFISIPIFNLCLCLSKLNKLWRYVFVVLVTFRKTKKSTCTGECCTALGDNKKKAKPSTKFTAGVDTQNVTRKIRYPMFVCIEFNGLVLNKTLQWTTFALCQQRTLRRMAPLYEDNKPTPSFGIQP